MKILLWFNRKFKKQSVNCLEGSPTTLLRRRDSSLPLESDEAAFALSLTSLASATENEVKRSDSTIDSVGSITLESSAADRRAKAAA